MLKTESLGSGILWIKANTDHFTANDKIMLESKYGFAQSLLSHLSLSEIPRFFQSRLGNKYRLFVYNTPVSNSHIFEPVAVAIDGHYFITFTRKETHYVIPLIEQAMHNIVIHKDAQATLNNVILKITYETGNKFLNGIKKLNSQRIKCETYLRDTEHNKYNDKYINRLLILNSNSVQYLTALTTDVQLLESVKDQLSDKLSNPCQDRHLVHDLSLHKQALQETKGCHELIKSEITTYKIKQANINNKKLEWSNQYRKRHQKALSKLGMTLNFAGISGSIWGFFGINSYLHGGMFMLPPSVIFLIGIIVPIIAGIIWELYEHHISK